MRTYHIARWNLENLFDEENGFLSRFPAAPLLQARAEYA
jgi:hypothetical protein